MTPIQPEKLFVSHAVDDARVANSLVELMASGIGIAPQSMAAAATEDRKIKPGADFKASIQRNIDRATTVVALISRNFHTNPICMCELGAAWLQCKDLIPILLPGVRSNDLHAVLAGLPALRLDSAPDLDRLRQALAEGLGLDPLPTPQWIENRDAFLQRLAADYGNRPLSPALPPARREAAEREASELQAALAAARDEIERLRSLTDTLKKAAGAKAPAAVDAEDTEAIERFAAMCTDVQNCLADLEDITKEAIFLSCLGEELVLGQSSVYSWDDARKPLQYRELSLNSYETGVCVNDGNRNVKKALESIKKLHKWLDGDAPEAFHRWYASENDGHRPDITDRRFWDRHLW